jgi:hypothetical protein
MFGVDVKTILNIPVLTFLLALPATPSLAMMSIAPVSPARAKELAMEIRAQPSGPDAVRIEFEFETKGELKYFNRVDLEIRDGGKLLLSSSLKEEKSKLGHVVVVFTADRAQLEKTTLTVVLGDFADVGYELRLKDFVDLKKVK